MTEGWATGEPWLAEGVRRLDGLEPSTGVLALATAIAVLGLVLVLAGLLPAGRHHVPASGVQHLWSSPSALAEVARSAADRSPGVVAGQGRPRLSRGRVVLDDRRPATASTDQTTLSTAREAAKQQPAPPSAPGRVDVRAAEEESA